jgi:hypothetical protein
VAWPRCCQADAHASGDAPRGARLLEYLNGDSRIGEHSPQASLLRRSATARCVEVPITQDLTRTGSHAMRSRGRRLVARLRDLDE